MAGRHALRGRVVSFDGDPFQESSETCLAAIEDGLVVIGDGKISAVGDYAALAPTLDTDVAVTRYEDALICPGFVDTHVHYPQMQMIGAYGEQLLAWLNKYTFVTEAQFVDKAHADAIAKLFFRELLSCGTTTAAVYCTVHPQSVDAFFEESERYGTLMVAGKVLMDRNAPDTLLDTAQRGFDESEALIKRWHGTGRNMYCVTPRFAPTSTDAQLDAAGALLKAHEGVFMQTHLSENLAEVDWVKSLFPKRSSYLDVYAHAGLAQKRAVFGHAIHLSEDDFCTCNATGVALSHCPTSNLFLGSGLFKLFDAQDARRPVRVGLGTDVGAGTSLSQLKTLGEAYKVAALSGRKLDAVQAFYLATAGGARSLYLDDRLGRVAPGYDADLCVLDLKSSPLLAFRMGYCESLQDILFVLVTLGDHRTVRATYVAGECVYDRTASEPFRYVR